MADAAWATTRASVAPHESSARHSATVRITHWLTVLCFFALLLSGIEILISHPRFYWGETGNVNMTPLFTIPIPSSRDTVPTGYDYVLPDQNGWSRALHFEAAWIVALTGLIYIAVGFSSRHFQKHVLPRDSELSWNAIAPYLRLKRAKSAAYNPLQKITYLVVVFILFPLVIWTGLAISPLFGSLAPFAVSLLGGQQSARTIHFFVSIALLAFLVIHLAMIVLAGFWSRVKGMVVGS